MTFKELFNRKTKEAMTLLKSEDGFGVKEIAIAVATIAVVGIVLALVRGYIPEFFEMITGWVQSVFDFGEQ